MNIMSENPILNDECTDERSLHHQRLIHLNSHLFKVHGEQECRTGVLNEFSEIEPIKNGKLFELKNRFGLNQFETDVLTLLWLNAFQPESIEMFGVASGITTLHVSMFYRHKPVARLPSESPLLLWKMVYEQTMSNGTAVLLPCSGILSWLENEPDVDRVLAGLLRVIKPCVQLSTWPAQNTIEQIQCVLNSKSRCTVVIGCNDVHHAEQFAAMIGMALGSPIVALHPWVNQYKNLHDVGLSMQRQAFLDHCIPYIESGQHTLLNAPYALYPLLLVHRLIGQPIQFHQCTDSERKIIQIHLNDCSSFEQQELWLKTLPLISTWTKQEQAELFHFPASFGDILSVANQNASNAKEAKALLRELSRSDLGPLVKRLDTQFGLDDLVLPKATVEHLSEIIFEGKERSQIWSNPELSRLYPYGKGLIALFAGSPGTGKTMAAQVIANTLGLDLLAVDLSAIVSKWVGETSQHLERLLSSKSAQRSVLFFDEADALYGKRVEDGKDAQDRYANLETSYLMTALENYPGIVILASNLRANIDNAFIRRIRHVVDFPKPNPDARNIIWNNILGTVFGSEHCMNLNGAICQLSQVETSAAVIKNTVLNALFICRKNNLKPTARVLLEALSKELSKDGTSLSNHEIESMIIQAERLQEDAA